MLSSCVFELQIDLSTQLSYFKEVEESLREKYGVAGARNVLGSAVYLFSVGGNDYVQFYMSKPNATQSDRRAYVGEVVGNITAVLSVRDIQVGRKEDWVLERRAHRVSPGEHVKSPNASKWCAKKLLAHSRLHNRMLAIALRKLEG
ncbi:GDSL esterase/lipase 3-like [Punica granatum]|uniref:GDSL esterase/lipase 3-like n=1 Tax=Punica granatum TaxID=22663 RepID=A0A6P8BYB3_PUNGR|nr:GDSL esterase/lipase 3-like [Punica granatum]